MIRIYLLTLYVTIVLGSECELSEWTEWSTCYGTCYYGQAVRNRDVIRPSLPDSFGAPTRRCPHLYETSSCTPDLCEGTSEIVDLPSESGRQKAPVKVVIEKQLLDKGGLENEVVHVPRKVNGGGIELRDLPRFPSEKRRSHGQRTRTVEQLAVELEADHRPSFKGEIIAEGRMLTRQNMSRKEANNNSGVFLDTLTVDLPKHLKPAKEKKILVAKQSTFSEDDEKYTAGQSQISDVLRELETATDFKTPLDDEHIRKVLRRNRKLMKALVEAYKLRTTTSTTTIATSSLPDEEDELNLYPSTTEESQDLSTATEPTANSTSTDDPNLQEDETTTSNFNTELPSTTEESSSSSEFLSATSDESEESSTPDNVSYIYDNPLDGDVRVPTRTTAESDFSDQGFTENTKPTEATVQHSESAVTEETDGKSFTDLLTSQDFDESSDALASNSFAENEDLEAYETTPSTTSVMTTEATTTTTTTPPYWPRKGYVPNTRKHASEITSKLYMTQEIVQALSDDPIRRSPILRLDCLENRRCCKITRTECSDGTIPKYVKRYYRPRMSEACVPYHYPRCSQSEEMEEQPIQYEQNCQDLCFRGPEKRISPLLMLSEN